MNWQWSSLLLHLLIGYPLYQILGTIRHELSHALAGIIQGIGVREIHVLPSHIDGKWYWGFVRYGVSDLPRWWVYLMPYFVNILHIIAGLWLVPYVAKFGIIHAWYAAIVLTLFSPVLDVVYNGVKFLLYDSGDFAAALRE